MRSWLYRLARLSGDVNSIRRGTVHKRLYNKVVGRKLVSKMWWR